MMRLNFKMHSYVLVIVIKDFKCKYILFNARLMFHL